MPLAEVPNLVPALPEIFLACAAMVLLMFGVFQKSPNAAEEANTARNIGLVAVTMLVLAVLLVAMVGGTGEASLYAFGGLFVVDPFASFFKVLVLIGSGLTLVVSGDYLKRQGIARFEYPVLVLFAVIGMMMMISANDLISLYLGLEIQSLSLYIIAAFQRETLRSTEAGLKYFVLGSVASGMLLYGSSMVYGFTGTTSFSVLAEMFAGQGGHTPSVGLIFGLVFIVAGLAFKVSAVPFHMWTPDVYEGAPTPVTAFFAVAPKIAGLALFIRVLTGPFGDLVAQWQQIVVLLSIASMVLGAFAAIAQNDIKRLMAYSSIGHVGYALIGLAVGDAAGVRGVMVYMSIYLFMNVGAFACILAMRRGDEMVTQISDLAGLSKTHPLLALGLAVFMFSMAGIPPLAGFFGKLWIFLAAIDAQLYTLAIIGVLSSVVAAFYYLRIVKVMYFDDVEESLDQPVGREISLVVLGTGLIILLFFVYPAPVINGAQAAAAALFAG
ncbi:MAG: NADH-quinone oxidoreductase subunit NuoN [Hyphomicrobiales bacterium]|nr:NADH-quinone oxidoreductase subunit NuoN [Hyphomicrobiales bacterium]MCP5372856.1 NADH-quinone oxidoreductase subunit NuoN [Hyphomicrobiales bacterium]